MGNDIASWRIYIGSFHPRGIVPHVSTSLTSNSTNSKDIKWPSYTLHSTISFSFVLLVLASSLTICMDIEPNPGPISTTMEHPTTVANSSNLTSLTLPQYTSLFNATKRIQLNLTRFKHHLLNYTFYKENKYIPASLFPRKSPLQSSNQKFHRRWRYISYFAAYRHLKLLITECHHKINSLTRELSHHKELLRNSSTPAAFLFYTSKLDSMALSLESLLTNRRAKKTAPIRHFVNNNLGHNSLNPQVNTNTDVNDNPS